VRIAKSVWVAAGALSALGGCGTPDEQGSTTAADEPLAAAAATLAALEQRRSLITDTRDIKRLQRAYGYYVDEALWDQVADLFAADGTIELGLDGIYVGKERVREYLYALGDGKAGLSEGELNEHFQLMPVVTVAPDGLTAKGRWRALILAGRLGESAIWGEGPYENEYVKEDGVWKLKKVHWYQSVVVPYETGWLNTPDVNEGKWVSGRLPPDRPPSIEYSTWPETYLPEFHFPNPVAAATPRVSPPASSRPTRDLETLATSAATLAQEVQLLEDENAIENLQAIYGFYVDKGFWSEAADLFAAEGTIEIGGSGVFVGKERVLEYLRSLGIEFPQEGRLFDQMQLQPIVHVAPDGRTAQARWHSFSQEAMHGEYARWGTGVYENEYVKEDGVWKILSLRLYTTMQTPYEDGWGKTALPMPGPIPDLPADRPPSTAYEAYPAVFVTPFHYENPVTGSPPHAGSPAQYAADPDTTVATLEDALAALEARVIRLEDTDAIERLDTIRAYYLAHSQWDNSAALFAPDGSIEIAMRGVYVGRASVRRNLNLYTEVGMQYGLLHNHMVHQPVIHIGDDGATAKMRARAFSIMGELGRYAQWMGGTYENEYVKVDGVWMVKRDHQINTYFALYAVGWKEMAPRAPPGITAANPPDLPPTLTFELYPRAFLPPYHYTNPVTGNAVTWP
jgi:hypothetical protein